MSPAQFTKLMEILEGILVEIRDISDKLDK